MDIKLILSLVIFAISLGLIISEKINRSVVALSGGILMILLHIMSEKEAIDYIDFNTLGVLIGMMIIVAIVKTTGLFEYVAIVAAKKTKGDPWKIILSFCIITAITSALLDNVTTVLLIAPMTLVITETLELDPIPFLITEILASNIGGTSTLIGDPPNIMIGSAAGLGFIDFLINLLPIIVVVFVATFFVLKLLYAKKLVVDESKKKEIMNFDEKKSITNMKLAKISMVVLFFVMLGFFFHEQLGYPSAVVALGGAMAMMIITRENVDEAFKSVEWSVIFFFMGLFIIVGGLEREGVMDKMAEFVINVTEGSKVLMGLSLTWLSALVSAFLDNIPFVATMIPMIKAMGAGGHIDVSAFWWAISLGACLGGNGTLIGASANVVVAGIATKQGYRLTFMKYLKIGFPLMLLSIILSSLYLFVFYLK